MALSSFDIRFHEMLKVEIHNCIESCLKVLADGAWEDEAHARTQVGMIRAYNDVLDAADAIRAQLAGS